MSAGRRPQGRSSWHGERPSRAGDAVWATRRPGGRLPSRRRADRPAGHRLHPQGQAGAPIQLPALVGAGTLRSTANDMLRFLRAKLDPAHTTRPPRSNAPSFPAPDRQAHRDRARLADRPPRAAGPLLWHNGGTPGFRSFIGVGRETGTAVVVLSNTARSVDRLRLRLLNVLSTHAARNGLSPWEPGLVGVGAWLAVALPP